MLFKGAVTYLFTVRCEQTGARYINERRARVDEGVQVICVYIVLGVNVCSKKAYQPNNETTRNEDKIITFNLCKLLRNQQQ